MTTAAAIKDQKRPSGSFLENIGTKVREEFVQFSLLDKEATWRALRIGLLLEHAKGQIIHGEFTAWLEKNVPENSTRTAQRFMRLARVFIEQKKLDDTSVLLLCEPDVHDDPKAKKVVHLVFEFFGDSSLNDLFDKYKIKERKPLGGARGNTHKKLTTAQGLERAKKVAYEEWNRAFELLSVDTKHKTYKYLDDEEIIKLIDCLQVTRDALRAELNQRKQDRK